MAKIFKILAIIYFNAYPIPLPAVVGNAVVGNASKRCSLVGSQPTVTLGKATGRRALLGNGVTHYTVTLGGVTHYVTHFCSRSAIQASLMALA